MYCISAHLDIPSQKNSKPNNRLLYPRLCDGSATWPSLVFISCQQRSILSLKPLSTYCNFFFSLLSLAPLHPEILRRCTRPRDLSRGASTFPHYTWGCSIRVCVCVCVCTFVCVCASVTFVSLILYYVYVSVYCVSYV